MIKLFEMFAGYGWDINLVSKIFKNMIKSEVKTKQTVIKNDNIVPII